MFTGIKHKSFATIGAGLAAAAIVASGASAKHVPVDLNGGGSGQVTQGYTAEALEAMNQRWEAMARSYWQSVTAAYGGETGLQPDGFQPQLTTQVPAALDRVEANRQALSDSTPTVGDDVVSRYLRNHAADTTTQFASSSDDGFDWGIFGIVSGSALALIALCGAALVSVRRGRIAQA
jgi:hypothetical protein